MEQMTPTPNPTTETPRTDAAEIVDGVRYEIQPRRGFPDTTAFARQLEQELSTAQREREEARESLRISRLREEASGHQVETAHKERLEFFELSVKLEADRNSLRAEVSSLQADRDALEKALTKGRIATPLSLEDEDVILNKRGQKVAECYENDEAQAIVEVVNLVAAARKERE